MTTYKIPLPGYPAPPLTMNKDLQWAVQRRIVQKLQGDVLLMARAVCLPINLGKVEVALHWTPAVERRRDDDNPAKTVKYCRDALVRYGVVKDDVPEFMTSPGTTINPVEKLIPIHRVYASRPLTFHARIWLTVTTVVKPCDDGWGDAA